MAVSFADLLPVPTDAEEGTRAERRRSRGINFDDLMPKAGTPAASNAISFDDLIDAAAPPQGVVSSPAAAANSGSAGGGAALSASSDNVAAILERASEPTAFQDSAIAPQQSQVPAPAATQVDSASIASILEQAGEPTVFQDPAITPQQSQASSESVSVASAFEPSLVQRLGQLFNLGSNRDRASNELAARQIAKDEGVSVDSVYKRFRGSRPTLNPEGRPALTALTEGAGVVTESLPQAPAAALNTIARAIRGGDIKAEDNGFLDYVIAQTKSPDTKIDANYQSLGNIGESLGYSLVTLVASATAGAATTAVTANPIAGMAAGFTAGAATSYRASVDDFLSRVKTNLDKQSNKLYGRPLDEDQWSAAANQYMGAAREYGAWEAIPEAASNLIFLKAFAAPLRGMKVDALTSVAKKAGAGLAEQVTETMTGFGQNKPELEAGLAQDQKSIRDAFKEQFLQTLLVTGVMAGGAKGVSAANDFYKSRVEPTIAPETALGRALLADLQEMGFSPESAQREAVARLSPDNAQMVARPISFDDLVPPAGVASPPPPPPPDDQGGGTAAAVAPVDPNSPVVDPNAPVVDPNAPAADPNAVVTPPAPAPYEQLSDKDRADILDLAKSVYEGREIILPIEYSWSKLTDPEREQFAQQFYPLAGSGLDDQQMRDSIGKLLMSFRGEVVTGRANAPAAAVTTPDPAATTTTATITAPADPNAPLASASMTSKEFLKSYVALQDIANGFNLLFKDLSDKTKAMLSNFVLRGNAGKLTLTPEGVALLSQLRQIKSTDEALNIFNAALGSQQQTTPAATTTPVEPTTPAATTTTITTVATEPTATTTVAAEPTATTTQNTVDANDPAVANRLKSFEGGVFGLSYATGAGGAANRNIAQQTNEQATKTYDAAAAIFLSRAFTAPVPAKNQDTLNVENIYNVTVTPVDKKIAAAKNDTSYRNALFKIAGNMDVRIILNGILIEPDTKIVAVTDGHRMAIVQDMDASAWYQTPESMDAYSSIVVGRDGKLVAKLVANGSKFLDWRGVQPNSAPESAFVSFDANAVAGQLRGVVRGYKYITGKGNKSTTTPQSIKINGVTGSFQAPYLLDAAEFFLRMGYTSFNAQFVDQDTGRLFLVSPDKRVQQVIMGLRDVRGEPVFAALASDTPANFTYDTNYSIITQSKPSGNSAGTPVVKPAKPKKPRAPKPQALAAFDTVSAILEDAGITDQRVATAVSTEYDRLTGLEEDDNGTGLDTGSVLDRSADGQPSAGVSRGGDNNEVAPASGDRQQAGQQRGGLDNGQDLFPSAEREDRQAQGGEPQNEPATTQAGTLDDQTLDELTLEDTDGAAANNQDRPAGGSTQGGTGMGGGGQADGRPDIGSAGQSSNYPNTRGTRVGAFVTAVSYTNRVSFFRDAFAQAGIDPAVANNLPIERQYRILADLLVSQFGVRFVDSTPRASVRKSVDELLDLHRNMQFMVAALELPMQTIGLEKTLGIVNMEKQQYFAVYFPQGLVLQARGTKELPTGKIMSGAFVGLPNRTNSFAHEWGHALDFFLQAEFARTHGGKGLSHFIRESGIAPQGARASEAAYVNLINTLFFDQTLTAAKIMELERKIATAQSPQVQATAQRLLDEIRAGSSKLRSTKGDYYKRVKQLGNDDYYLQPTEMIARSFETYISTIVENLGGSTEALTKSLSAYNNQAVDYMQNAYPQQADRDAINAAWSAVFDALRAESVLNKTGAPAATKPVDANIIDPFEMLRLTPDSRSLIQREVDAWKDLKAEASRNNQRAPNPKGAVLLYQDAMRSFLWSERGGLLTMIARYPNSPTIKNIVSRLTTDPGTSNLNNRLTFEESRSKAINQFGARFGEILKRYKLDKLDANGTEVLRRMLVSQPDKGLPTLAAMAQYPQLTEAADKIRNLFNDLWYYGDNAGVKMGYAPNGYLPRMYDMTKIVTDGDGFRAAAERVYNEMFDTKYEDFRSDDDMARGVLVRALQILRIKPKRLPMHATGFSQTEADDIKDAVKAYKAAIASLKAAPNAQDPGAAAAAAEQEMDAALNLIDGVYEAIKTVDGNLRAANWLQEAWVGSAEANNSYSPDAEFLKGRVLPPSADVLMRDYMNTDVVSLINDYIPKIVNKAEYERRFGRMDMADAKRQLYKQGVLPDDVAYIFQTIEKLTGRSHDNSLGAMGKVVSKIQAYGIMAVLGRAVMSAAAEPLGAAIQTRDVRQGFQAVYVTLANFLPTASARDRQTIAEVIGLVGNPYMDQALANREGGQFLNDPNLNQRMAKYFIFTLQHGWLKNTTIGALSVAQNFLRNRISTTLDSSLKPAERDRAMRDLKEMGLQSSDVDQFFQWMQNLDSSGNGDSLLSGRKLSIDELQSDMGQLYSDMLYRMTRKIILDPQPTDTSAFSKTTLGRAIMSIQSFAYTFQRQYLAAAVKKIQEEYKTTGSIGQTSRVAAGIASGFAALYVGHTLISTLRELIFNPARLAEKEREDELLSYLLKLGFSRAGFAGAFDPLLNAVEGLKYEKDVANTLIGAVPSYFAQALQKMLMPFARNSEKTNTAEYNAITGFYELALVPLLARGMTSLPVGPITTPLIGIAYGYATSPAAKKAVAEFFVGEKPQPKRRKAEERSSTYGF